MDELAILVKLALAGLALGLWAYARHKTRTLSNRRPSVTPPPLPLPRGTSSTAAGASVPSPPPARIEPLDLSLGEFKPLSPDEARREARSLGSPWQSAWFGRRDRIPPAEDARTHLIDRAMVAQGLITPEELIEIHQVGRQMDEIRPDLAQANIVADQAVRQAQEDRKQLKERKKAEAAERRRAHAEAVARRRATDILFLGRGVSGGLSHRESDTGKLGAAGLPVLATPADVAAALQLSIPRLRWLAFHSEAATVIHYVRFNVPKKSGGTRALFAPHEQLASAQEWILDNILGKIPTHEAAHGFVASRSTVTNAAPHVGKTVVVNADLVDFFPTVTFPRVRGIFRQLGYSGAVSTILALLCTESPRRDATYAGKTLHVATGPRALPQGACTSPALSNLAARRLDARLAGIARKLDYTYTRYADDLTFSSPDPARIGYLLARLRHIAQDEGFTVNEKKTRVLRQSASQTVTGIVVNDRVGIPRDTVRRLRAILHRAKSEGLAAQNRENHPHFDSWLRGMLAYVQMVNPKQAAPLLDAYRALPRGRS